MERSFQCMWPQGPLLEKYHLWWKAESTLRNTGLLPSAGSQRRYPFPPRWVNAVALSAASLLPGEGQAGEHLAQPGFPSLGEGAILCINLRMPGDSVGKTN